MGPRLAYQDSDVLQRFVKHIKAAGAVVTQSGWPEPIQNLMLIPASQIDGCAVCVGMHTKDAEHAGEPALRLNLVEAWRDAEVFNEEERTALELAEQGTRIDKAAGGVTDDAFVGRVAELREPRALEGRREPALQGGDVRELPNAAMTTCYPGRERARSQIRAKESPGHSIGWRPFACVGRIGMVDCCYPDEPCEFDSAQRLRRSRRT